MHVKVGCPRCSEVDIEIEVLDDEPYDFLDWCVLEQCSECGLTVAQAEDSYSTGIEEQIILILDRQLEGNRSLSEDNAYDIKGDR